MSMKISLNLFPVAAALLVGGAALYLPVLFRP